MIAAVLLIACSAGLVGVFALIALAGSVYEPNTAILLAELLGSAAILAYALVYFIRQLRKAQK